MPPDLLTKQTCSFPNPHDWPTSDLLDPNGGVDHFRRHLSHALEFLAIELEANSGYASVVSIEIARFTPLVSYRREVNSVPAIATCGDRDWLDDFIGPESTIAVPIRNAVIQQKYATYTDFQNVGERLLIRLHSHGELFGYICLDCESGRYLPFDKLISLQGTFENLVRHLASEVFSLRVRQLARPFESTSEAELYERIVDRTVMGFGADACILRTFDESLQALVVREMRGELTSEMIQPRDRGKGGCGQIFISDEYDWAAIYPQDLSRSKGCSTNVAELTHLKENRVHALLIIRLETEIDNPGCPKRIGTLSFLIRRPHLISYRDVALFRAFGNRVADSIALQRSYAELANRDDIVVQQAQQLARVEIVALLAHDLMHKAINSCETIESFIDKSKKAMKKEGRGQYPLEEEALKAMNCALEVHNMIFNIRSLQGSNDAFEVKNIFHFQDVVQDLQMNIGQALTRNKITLDLKYSGPMDLYGSKILMAHILFNLVNNAIDAKKTRTSKPPTQIHIHTKSIMTGDQRKLIVTFWDDGTGINRQVFRDPNEIFDIGKTTRPNGTGTGLPVSRNLLHRHFGGDLKLILPEKAMFQLDIPQPTK